jgi:hypothetical protein
MMKKTLCIMGGACKMYRIREAFLFKKPEQKGPFARTEDEHDYNRK